MAAIDFGKFAFLVPIPLTAGALGFLLWRDLTTADLPKPEWRPFVFTAGLFLTGYLGLAISLFPYIVPFAKTISQTAARDNALLFLLIGASVMLPVILGYTALVYRLFWGKTRLEDGYHG